MCRGIFFLKNNKRADQKRLCRGNFFLKINKRADQNKNAQGGIFFSKLINLHARLFGTLEYLEKRGSKRPENELRLRNLLMVPKADPSITPYG